MFKVLKILQIKDNEFIPSIILFLHSFFLVMVVITSKTVRDTLFLTRYDNGLLPIMYILTALIMWAGVPLIQKFFKGTIIQHNISLPTSFLFGTVLFIFLDTGIFIPVMYLWVEIMTTLMGMKFWEVATNTFNNRQGKRLFGVVTSGGSISGVITGMSISNLVIFGTDILIVITSLGIVVCMFLIYLLKNHLSIYEKGSQPLIKANKFSFSNLDPYLRHILIVVILIAALSTFIDYQFKIDIGNQFNSEAGMIKFFGYFYTVTGILSIVLQLFFSGRILSFFGISAGIQSYPLMIIICSVSFIFFIPFFTISLFKGVDQILKPTMLGTTMELLWLPVSKKKKKLVKPFFNSTIKPMVQALAAFIIIIFSTLNFYSYTIYSIIILTSIILLVVISKTKIFYYEAVNNSIDTRRLDINELDFDFSLPSVQQTIKSQLITKDKFSLLFIIDLIKNQPVDPWLSELVDLTKIDDDDLQFILISNFGFSKNLFSTEKLYLISESNRKSSPVAIKHLIKRENIDYKKFDKLASNSNEIVKFASRVILTKKNDDSEELKNIQNQILDSELIIDILKYIDKDYVFSIDFVEKLFALDNTEIKLICLKSFDLSRYPHLLESTLKSLNEFEYNDQLIKQLLEIDIDILFPVIEKYIQFSLKHDPRILKGIPKLLILISDSRIKPLIKILINKTSVQILNEISFSISNSKQSSNLYVDDKTIIDTCQILAKTIFQNFAIMNSDSFISKDDFINDYFKYKVWDELECLIRLSCIFLHENVTDSYIHSIKQKDKQVPFIIEALEHKLPSAISSILIPIIEIESNKEKLEIGNKLFELNNNLKKQCIDLFDSKDDWLQAIISYLIAREGREDFNTQEIVWESLKPNMIADEVIDMRKFKTNPILEIIKNYIKDKEDSNMYSVLEKISTLKKIDLFSTIPSKIIYHISQITHEIEFLKGEGIFKEGDYGDYMLVIAKGRVRIHKDQKTIIEASDGECFGEMSILDGEPRSASATALEDSVLFKIKQRDFSQVLSNQDEVMKEIIKILTKRLRNTTEKLYTS